MIKLQCYKSPYGIFIRDTISNAYWWDARKFNSKTPIDTHSKQWKLLEGEDAITSITVKVNIARKVIGYTLKDPALANDKIPETLSVEDVGLKWDDDDEYWAWSNYSTLRSLYSDVYDEPRTEDKNEEFEVTYLGELSVADLDAPHKATVSIVKKTNDRTTVSSTVTISSLAEYNEIVKAIVPDIVIHTQPCVIPSHVAFGIVRAFIKNNIDAKVATITSDYDFCFNVKKKISIKPIAFRKEIFTARGKSYRPPRFKNMCNEFKEIDVFEMTHSRENYRGYTPIAGFAGDNLKDLVDNVQFYLEELISYINTPIAECSHCGGSGHIIGETFKMNVRGT